MRRLLALSVLSLALSAAALPAAAGAVSQSPNFELLAKRPEATGAIGARFSADGRTMYVTAATGLFIYDVSKPAAPERFGFQPLPHFEDEDEDVDVGPGFVVITDDPSFSTVGVTPRFVKTFPMPVPKARAGQPARGRRERHELREIRSDQPG